MIRINIQPRTLRIISWTVLTGVGVGVVIWAVVYWATHGQLAIVSPAESTISSISYCKDPCSQQIETTSTNSIVPSGNYVVQVNLSNSTTYITNVQVAGFFKTSTIAAKSKKYSPSVIAIPSSQYVLPMGNAYLTYEPGNTAYTTNSSVSMPLSKLATAQYIDQDNILLVEYSDPPQESVSPVSRVVLYNIVSKSLTNLGTVSNINTAGIIHSNNTIYALRADTLGHNLLTMSSSGVSETKFPTTLSFAANDNLPIVTVSDNYIAVLSGNDYFVAQADEQESPSRNESVVTIYDKSFQKIREIKLGIRSDISSLSLSPDSKKIAIVGEDTISTYSTETGETLFQTKAQNSNGKALIWRNDTSFIYQLGVGGVYLSDLNSKESYSIIDTSLLRITDISAVIDNKIYLTAFPNQSGNYDRTEPDGYMVDLTKDVSSQPSIEDHSIVRSLPYDGMTYKIGYHFDQSSRLVIDITAAVGARNSAIEKMSELGFDPGDYSIHFQNYTNPFNNKAGGGE